MRSRRNRWLLAAVLALSACGSPATSTAGPEPKTAHALMAVAQVFNDDYGRGRDGPVYDRWDARSKAVIGRAEYLRRHAECPTAPQQPATVESAAPGPHGTWLVRYRIGDQQFVDHWLYTAGRWQFDLLLSNPDAVRLYRLPGAQYVAAVGCARH